MSLSRRAAFAAVLLVSVSPTGVMAQASKTPIEHVIVIVGENQSRLRKFGQGDKWSFCLTAGTLWPANQERP
jgi:hypothetical protein